MKIVGIDASTNYTGIAIEEDARLLDYTVIDCHLIKDTDIRVGKMLQKITDYLDNFDDIDKVVMEESILKTNVNTVKYLSFLMGGVMLYALQRGIGFEKVLPTQWRAKCHIKQDKNTKREELKAEAIRAVSQEYNITVSDDVAEAILIAKSGFIER